VNGSAACTACRAGTYNDKLAATTCLSCPSASHSLLGGSDEEADCTCNAGYTGAAGAECSECIAGTWKAVNGSSSCILCASGKYSSEPAEVSEATCDDCPAHSYSADGSNTRTNCTCHKGYSGPDGSDCQACVVGTWKAVNGSSSCILCASGKYSSETGEIAESTCTDCPAATYSGDGSELPTDCTCNRGYTGADGGPCTECVEGKYKGQGAGSFIGYTAIFPALNPAESARSYSSIFAHDAVGTGHARSMLDSAQAWSASTNNVNEWMIIDLGSIMHVAGVAVQNRSSSTQAVTKFDVEHSIDNTIFASTGTGFTVAWARDEARSNVLFQRAVVARWVKILPKAWNDWISMRAGVIGAEFLCQSCLSNSFSSAASTSAEACVCNAGYTGPDGQTCVSCAPGKYKTLPGAAACTDCAAGKFSATAAAAVSSVCNTCLVHSQSDAGSVVCQCNAGASGVDSNTCILCAAGKYKAARGQALCDNCPTATYLPSAGAVSIDACQSCPTASSAAAASVEITDCTCNAGATGLDGENCVSCVAGKYKASTGSEGCDDCIAGKYSAVAGAVAVATCLTCPGESHAPSASNEQTDCTCNAGFGGQNGDSCHDV